MPVFMVTFIKGLKVMRQPILPPYCAIYLVRHAVIDCDGLDFFVKDTFGINKTI